MIEVANFSAEEAVNVVNGINWAAPTWDLFIIIFFLLSSFIYGISLGRDRILSIMISIYMAIAVVSYAPFISTFSYEVNVDNLFVVKITAFLAIFVLFFFLLSRSALHNTIADNRGNFLQVLVFSVLHVGLLISVVLSFLPQAASEALSPLTQQIFVSEVGRLVWIIAPILAMAILKDNND